MTRSRSTLHNTAFTLSGQIASRLLALAYYGVLARAIGPQLYGDLGLGVSVATLFVVLLEPGLNPLLIRDGARDPAVLEARFAEALGYKLAMLFLAWPLTVGAGAALGFRGTTLWSALLAGGTLLLVTLEDVAAAALVAQERMDLEGTLRTLSKALTAGCGFVAIALHGSYVAILAAMVGGGCATALAGTYLVRRSGLRIRLTFDVRQLEVRIAEAWPLAVTTVIWMVLLRLDQLLASELGAPRADVGDYNAAVKLVEALILFPTAVAMTFQPLFARAWQKGAEPCSSELQLALEAALSLTLPIALGGAVVAGPIATLVYGHGFAGAGPLLAVQLLTLPLIALQFTCFGALVAAGALRVQTAVVAVNLGVNVLCNLLLVPRLGIQGATLSALWGGIASSVACLAAVRTMGMRAHLLEASWRPLVAALGMAALVWKLAGRLPLPMSIAAGALGYAGLFVALGGLRVLSSLMERRDRVPAPLPTDATP